ncbi:MAG: DUF5749 family beta-barrel protein [Methanosarcinales archaeon]|nr:DUF5749 family beta-barrel protein [Methanosarcinales archaeon]
MGITKSFKKLMGRSGTKDETTPGKDGQPVVSATNVHLVPDTAVEQNSYSVDTLSGSSDRDRDFGSDSYNDRKGTNQNRQVGSTWEHKHGDLDWHSMSRPHPLQIPTQAEKVVASAPGIPAGTMKADTSHGQVQEEEKVVKKQDILCKFVVQNNTRIGETISIDSGRLVFKSKAEKLSIPMSSITSITDEIIMVGDFKRDEALKLGEEWYKRTTNALKFDEHGMLIND